MSTNTPTATELEKLIPTTLAKTQERLRKVAAEHDHLASQLAKVTAARDELLLKAAPAKGVLRAVPITG